MRLNLALAVLLFSPTVWVLAEQTELSKESDAHQMFVLREEVSRNPGSPDFYAGEVACAFNDTATCEDRLNKVIAAAPQSTVAKQAHHILAYAAFREGRYERTFHEIEAVLKIDPTDNDRFLRPFYEASSYFPDQAVQESSATKTTIHMDNGKLPLLINGKKASYFFDTGGYPSTITMSEAMRLQLVFRPARKFVGSVEIEVGQTALAASLSLGGVVLKNVVFVVAPDGPTLYPGMEPGVAGLIGLPVLRALGSIKWSREGVFEIDRSPREANVATANLYFDYLTLIAKASFEQQELPCTLNTSGAKTELWPKFAEVAGKLIRKSGKRESLEVDGFMGKEKLKATVIPRVSLQLGGRSVTLQPAHVLENGNRPGSQWFCGNLGNDLLAQAQEVTIDFRTMTLELGSTPRGGCLQNDPHTTYRATATTLPNFQLQGWP